MLSYYYLKKLTLELRDLLTGTVIEDAYTSRLGLFELSFAGEGVTGRVVTNVKPPHIAIFEDRQDNNLQTNTYHLFDDIFGKKIQKIRTAYRDRQLFFDLEAGYALHFLLFPPRPNILLVHDGLVTSRFKQTREPFGTPAPSPRPAVLHTGSNTSGPTRKRLLHLNPLIPREHLGRLIEQHNLEGKDDSVLSEFLNTLADTLEQRPEPRLLQDGSFTAIPARLLDLPTERVFTSMSEGLRYAYYHRVYRLGFEEELSGLRAGMKTALVRLDARIRDTAQQERTLTRADRYERFGHLLMAQGNRAAGIEQICLPDYFNENEEITIPLKPDKDLIANAGDYYEKARKSRRSAEESQRLRSRLLAERDRLQALSDQVATLKRYKDLERWKKEHLLELKRLNMMRGGEAQQAEPFSRVRTGRYEIWIGRNAAGNDSLTAKAHKEDLWLHARGVPGSHVVVRMNKSRENPPRPVVLEAASFAAYFSRARGSSLVPVIVTRKKFVRKPKGADPGQVVVEREEVVMVEPAKPE